MLSGFAGAGGLDLGFESAGFRILACIENDPIARATLAANRPKRRFLQPFDISKLAKTFRPTDIGLRVRELGILAGGPPCQPFSKAAQWTKTGRRGTKDPKMKSLRAFMSLAEALLPRVILIENVPGFIQGPTSTIAWFKRRLTKINRTHHTKYTLQHRQLDAVEYGVPQRRERAILIACRDGRKFSWP